MCRCVHASVWSMYVMFRPVCQLKILNHHLPGSCSPDLPNSEISLAAFLPTGGSASPWPPCEHLALPVELMTLLTAVKSNSIFTRTVNALRHVHLTVSSPFLPQPYSYSHLSLTDSLSLSLSLSLPLSPSLSLEV